MSGSADDDQRSDWEKFDTHDEWHIPRIQFDPKNAAFVPLAVWCEACGWNEHCSEPHPPVCRGHLHYTDQGRQKDQVSFSEWAAIWCLWLALLFTLYAFIS